MVQSMTAYTRYEVKRDWGTAIWELRSVNHRYLEVFTKLPEQFRGLEMILREKLRSRLTRGKVECSLSFALNHQQPSELRFNQPLAQQLLEAATLLQQGEVSRVVNIVDILRWPGVMQPQEQDLDTISTEILTGFTTALDGFIDVRQREGQQLDLVIQQKLNLVEQEVSAVRSVLPEILLWQRERLQTRLQEAGLVLDETRLEQELLLLAQKMDVAEELDRLEVHLKETRAILKRHEAIGRRLDFMMQEFNRETNTLGSKSINSEITAHAIQLKVLIEQMREQIQNIE